MTTVHLVLVIATMVTNTFSAAADFARLDRIQVGMERIGVPVRLLPWLGVPKAAAVLGLLVGFAAPWLGIAAAAGLVLFYLLAIGTHLRVGDRVIGLPVVFLMLASGTLVTAPA
jgi:hypothetical protein